MANEGGNSYFRDGVRLAAFAAAQNRKPAGARLSRVQRRDGNSVNGRNLIVYGENGAGKSSLYKALRDLFTRRPRRDALKSNAHVHALDPLLTPRVTVTFSDGSRRLNGRRRGILASRRRTRASRWRRCAVPSSTITRSWKPTPSMVSTVRTCSTSPSKPCSPISPTLHPARPSPSAGRRPNAPGRTSIYEHNYITQVEAACAAFNAGLEAALDAMLPIINNLLADLGRHEMRIEAFERGTVRYNNSRLKKDRGFAAKELYAKLEFRGYYPQQPPALPERSPAFSPGAGLLSGRPSRQRSLGAFAGAQAVGAGRCAGWPRLRESPAVLAVLEKHFADWQIVLLTHDRHWFESIRAAIPTDRWTCHGCTRWSL